MIEITSEQRDDGTLEVTTALNGEMDDLLIEFISGLETYINNVNENRDEGAEEFTISSFISLYNQVKEEAENGKK